MTHKKYSKNNLIEVIFKIKYLPLLDLYNDDESSALKFHSVIDDVFPDVEYKYQKKVNLKADQNGKPIERITDDDFITWIFFNKTNNQINKRVMLNANELNLSYAEGIYSNFNEFLYDVKLILKGLCQYDVPKIKFIGLRYINQFNINDKNKLDDYINSNLNIFNKFDDAPIIQSLNRTEFRFEDYILAFQFGEFNPEYPSISSNKDFILDYDCSLHSDEDFENILKNLNEMHRIISDKFQKDISEKLKQEMR